MKKSLMTILLMSFIVLLLAACGDKTYEIDKEVSVSFEGYNEHGEAAVFIDKDALYSALHEEGKIEKPEDMTALQALVGNLDIQAKPNENLKNDDQVELDLSYDEENSLKYNLKLKDSKVKVENLDPITTLSKEDIFAGIDIQYEGVSPFIQPVITENSSSDVSSLFNYSISEDRLAEGDEITITAEPYDDLLNGGYQADSADYTNTVEVPKAEKYVENWKDLNEEDQDYILSEVQDVVTAQIDSELQTGSGTIFEKGKRVTRADDLDKVGKSEIVEQYFLFLKENVYKNESFNYDRIPNDVRFLYKNEIIFGEVMFNDEYSNKERDYYAVIGANNLITDEEGKLVRNKVEFKVYEESELDRETIKNEGLYKLKDTFTMDEFELEAEMEDNSDNENNE